MQLQPKAIDSSQNVIDIRKARNANELITVLGRIHTALRLQLQTYAAERNKIKASGLDKLYASLSWALQSRAELQCASFSLQHLQDTKREKCKIIITKLRKDLMGLRNLLLTRINVMSKPTVSARLENYGHVVHDYLKPLCEKLVLLTLYKDNETCLAFSAKNMQSADGFVSNEVCVKLTEAAGIVYVSFPDSAFVETDRIALTTQKQLRTLLQTSLTNYVRRNAPSVDKEDLLRLDGIKSIDVSDTLNLHLDSAVLPADINRILKSVLPKFYSAFGTLDGREVLHRFANDNGERTLQFALAGRKLVDPRALQKATKILSLSKSQVEQVNTMLERP